MTKAPFNKINERVTEFLTQLCAYGYVFLMRHKLKSLKRFKEFHNEVENQLGKKIKFNNHGEYLSIKFNNHLKQCEIIL
jgi:hypothetical protein